VLLRARNNPRLVGVYRFTAKGEPVTAPRSARRSRVRRISVGGPRRPRTLLALLLGICAIAVGIVVATSWGSPSHGPLGALVGSGGAGARPGSIPTKARDTTVRMVASDSYGRLQTITLNLGGGLRPRTIWVYRPNVPESADLPVTYFLHGVPGTPSDVFKDAHLADAMHSYLAAGGRPFVVASLDGRGQHHHDTEWVNAVDGTDPIATIALGPEIAAVEGTARRDGAHRAIAGYSMGGYGAMNLAMNHPGMFGQVVAIGGYFHVDDPSGMLGHAPATIAANSPDLHPAAARGLRLMLVDGTGDTDRSARGQTTRFAGALAAVQVPATTIVLPGAHTWRFVTAALARMLTFLGAGWSGPSRP
jgi:S-formylglutathione hydrolase FrmB